MKSETVKDQNMKSETVKDQKREYTKTWRKGGHKYAIVATVRYDDNCGNGSGNGCGGGRGYGYGDGDGFGNGRDNCVM